MPQFYIALLLWGWMGLLSHPFYISLTEIRQNPNSGRLEMAQKMFWDDLEVELRDFSGENVDILNPEDKEQLNQLFASYLTEKNKIQCDAKMAKMNYLGYEIEEDAIWFYLESEPLPPLESLQMTCEVLLANFDSQQNIVHVYFPGYSAPKSLLLGKGEETGSLKK
ncbi:DUF6702 family protein [Algoriphagus namhaensis]